LKEKGFMSSLIVLVQEITHYTSFQLNGTSECPFMTNIKGNT